MVGEDAALECTALDGMDWDAGGINEEGSAEAEAHEARSRAYAYA